MRLWIQGDDGQLLGTYIGGRLSMNTLVDKDLLAFELFRLTVKLMNVGGGASYGGSLAAGPEGPPGPSDFDMGTP